MPVLYLDWPHQSGHTLPGKAQGNGEKQAYHHHTDHATNAENHDIKQRVEGGGDRRQNQQGQRRAARGSMNDSNQHGTQAEAGPFEVVVMFMPLRVNRRNQPGAENDQHDRDTKLQPLRQPFGHRDFETDYRETDDGECECVAEAPEQADRATARDASFFADKGCDRDDVIRIGCVFESKQETDSEYK